MKFETKTVNRYFQIFNKQDRFIEFLSFPLEKPQLYTESHDHFAYFGNTEIERIRKQGEKTIRHMDLWINEFSRNILAPAATFRFYVDYVNFLISRIYSALLQTLNMRGIAGFDAITCFPVGHDFIGFFRQFKIGVSQKLKIDTTAIISILVVILYRRGLEATRKA